jgi:hypothetical protein
VLLAVDPLAVLLSIEPSALVLGSVWPFEEALAVLDVVFVVTFVDATVGPFEDTVAVEF